MFKLLIAKLPISIFELLIGKLQLEKYKNYDFGRCPRVYCCGQPCLPVGQSDIPRSSTVKIYCPKCEDIYYPRSKYQGSILFTSIMYCPSAFFFYPSCCNFILLYNYLDSLLHVYMLSIEFKVKHGLNYFLDWFWLYFDCRFS